MTSAALRAFPLLLLPALLYALLAIGLGDQSMRAMMADPAFVMTLPSGAAWVVGKGHLLTGFAAAMLIIEVMKAARPTTPSLVENALALFCFAGALIVFLLVRAFGTMEFFLIMAMMALDFLGSATVMVFTARRTVAYT